MIAKTTPGANGPELLSVAQVSARTGLSEMTVYRRIWTGQWPAGRSGRKRLLSAAFVSGLIAAIGSGCPGSAEEFAADWKARQSAEAVS